MSLINNTKWVALAQIAKVLCQIISLVVLARLIPPAEYGLMAMAGVIVALGFLFRDMGTSAALIQKKDLTEELKNAVFWLNIIIGFVVAIAIICASPFAATYFSQPDLVCVLILLSLSFPITSSSSSHLALIERNSQFKKVAFIESISSLSATTLAIIAAYLGWGVYSLVIQSLLNAILSTLLIWHISEWKPSLYGYRYFKEIKQIFSFSGNLVAFNFVNYFSRNTDRWVIGKVMTSAVLGAYDLAYRVMLFPLQTFTFVVSRSMLPVLSQYQDNKEKFNKTYLDALCLISFLAFPLMSGLMILREPFVKFVFGNQWSLVASILFWLAPTGMLQALNSTTGAVLTAKGKTNILFYTGILSAVIYVSCFLISASYDIVKFSEYYFYSNILVVGLNLYILFKVIKINVCSIFTTVFPVVSACFIFVLAVYFVKKYIDINLFNFIGLIFFGGVVYLFSYYFMPNNLIKYYISKRMSK